MDTSDNPSRDKASGTPEPTTSDRQGLARAAPDDSDHSPNRRPEKPRRAATRRADPGEGTRKSTARAGKGRNGARRLKSKGRTTTDLRQQILDQLSALVNVIDRGERGRQRVGKMAARGLVRSAVKGDPQALSQILQVLNSLDRLSEDSSTKRSVTERRSLYEIILDFRWDMREEAKRMLTDATGRTHFSAEEINEAARDVMRSEHPPYGDSEHTLKTLYLMSVGLSDMQHFRAHWKEGLDPKNANGAT